MPPGSQRRRGRDKGAAGDELGLEISSLGYYPGHLDAGGGERARIAEYFQTLLRLAADLGVPVVSTHAAGSVLLTLEEMVAQFVESSPLAWSWLSGWG